ncbi:MAG: Lpg1974 family pore-forming outer membrane protein [Verrucomicrobiota bacterium]
MQVGLAVARITISTVILFGVSFPSIASADEFRESGLYFSYEATFFKFHFTHDDAFLDLNSLTETASTESFGWDFQYAPRFEAGYIFEGCETGVRVRYFALDGASDARYVDRGSDFQGLVIANVDPTIVVNTSDAGEVLRATRRVELDTLDLEWFTRGNGKSGSSLVWGAGLRRGQVQHYYMASNPDRPAAAAHAAVSNGFEGFGPVFFAEGSQQIGDSPFSFIFGARGSLLFGETNYAIEQRDLNTGALLEREFENGFGTLPIIEGQVGLRYDKPGFMGGHLSVNAALEGQYWFNAGTGLINVTSQVTNGGSQTDERDSGMGLIGGVLEVEYTFPEHFQIFNFGPGSEAFERSGPYFAWESTFLQPRFSRDDAFHRSFANGTTGEMVPFDWDFSHAPRIEFGYHFGESNQGIRARYWSWEETARQSQEADPNVTGVDVIASQSPFIRSRSTTVDTSHTMELETFDLDFFRENESTGSGKLKLGAGLRYASIDHRYQASTDTSVFPAIFARQPQIQNGFQGIGPTVFAEGDYRVGNSNFSLIANVRGSLLFGESYLDIRDGLGSDNRVFDHSDNHGVLPIVESQVGLRYDNPDFLGGHLAVTTALEGQFWMNAGAGYIGPTGTGTGAIGNSDVRDADLGLVGGVVRVEYQLPENFDRFDWLLPPGTPGDLSHGPWMSVENTFLQPHFSRADAFQVERGSNNVVESISQEWGTEYAPRFEVGYQFENTSLAIRGRYWTLNAIAGSAYVQPNNTDEAVVAITSAQQVRTRLAGDQLSSEQETSLSAFDLEVMTQRLNPSSVLRFGGGFRYAQIEHLFHARVTGAILERVNASYAFQGFGPTVFGEVDYPIGDSSFSLVGQVRASVLFGDSDYLATESGGDTFRNIYETALLPVFESQFGIKYEAGDACRILPEGLSITAAVEGQYWVDAGTGHVGTLSTFGSGSGASDARDEDLGLIGGVLKVGYEF